MYLEDLLETICALQIIEIEDTSGKVLYHGERKKFEYSDMIPFSDDTVTGVATNPRDDGLYIEVEVTHNI